MAAKNSSSSSSAPKNKNSDATDAARAVAQDFDPKVKVGRGGKVKKRRWYHNMVDGYRVTNQIRPKTKFWVWGSVIVLLAVFITLAAVTGRWFTFILFGIMAAFIAGLGTLTWQMSGARYDRLDGQLGAVSALLGEGRRGWSAAAEPIAINPRTRDLVYRIVGRPGVVLISEGPASRVSRMLDDEAKRITRVMAEVPVHKVQVGNEKGQVHISKMWSTIGKLKGSKLRANEIAALAKRLDAMAAKRMPIPKGIDPAKARISRRALRGR